MKIRSSLVAIAAAAAITFGTMGGAIAAPGDTHVDLLSGTPCNAAAITGDPLYLGTWQFHNGVYGQTVNPTGAITVTVDSYAWGVPTCTVQIIISNLEKSPGVTIPSSTITLSDGGTNIVHGSNDTIVVPVTSSVILQGSISAPAPTTEPGNYYGTVTYGTVSATP